MKLKKILTITFSFILSSTVLMSCSDSDNPLSDPDNDIVLIEGNYPPNPMDAHIPFKAINSQTNKSILGHGYDITGLVASSQPIKEQIIDMDKLQEYYPESVTILKAFSSFSHSFYGENKAEYLRNMPFFFLDYDLRDQEELKNKQLLTKIFSDYDFLAADRKDYSYMSEHYYYLRHRYFFNVLTTTIKPELFLKQSFIDDLNNLPSQEIIEKYGTHVISEFYDGIRFDMFYMAKIVPFKYLLNGEEITIERDKRDAIKVGVYNARGETESGFLHWSGMPENAEELLKANINPILCLNSVGGNPDIVPKGFFNLDKGFPKSKQSEWNKSADDINNDDLYGLAMIRRLEPIYKWIKDETKKAEVKQAVLEYIDASQLK